MPAPYLEQNKNLIKQVEQGKKINFEELKKCYENSAVADFILTPEKFATFNQPEDWIAQIQKANHFNAQLRDELFTGVGLVFQMQQILSRANRDINTEIDMKEIEKLNTLSPDNRKAAIRIDAMQVIINQNLSDAKLLTAIKEALATKFEIDPQRIMTAIEGLASSTTTKENPLIEKITRVNLSMLDKIEEHRARLVALGDIYQKRPKNFSDLFDSTEKQIAKEIKKCDMTIKQLENNKDTIDKQKDLSLHREAFLKTRPRSHSSSQTIQDTEEVKIEIEPRKPGLH